MIADHYVIGVGPGNWRIEYPRYSSPGDPNIETGYIPVRRFPQGEWIGTAAERGIPSILVIVGIGVVLVTRWFEAAFRSRSRRRTQYAYVGILTLTALVTIGLFDPVIMTPTAGFVVPVLLGVCAGPFARMRRCAPTPLVRRTLLIGIGLVGVFLLNFQIRDVVGALVYSNAQSSAGFVQAARIAPGDFSARFLAANALARIGDCTRATPHIEAAMQLYPTAPAIQNLIRLCPSNPSL